MDTVISHFCALDAATGDVKWTVNMGEIDETSAAIGDDGSLYVGSWDGHMYSVSPS
jgi:outer membrane protein assembly factor BamB